MLLENIFPFTDPVFKRYFSKKSDIEQSKMIVDMIISIIEEEVDTQIPMEQLLDELAKRLHHIRSELEAGNCPRDRLNAMKECLEKGSETLEKWALSLYCHRLGRKSRKLDKFIINTNFNHKIK